MTSTSDRRPTTVLRGPTTFTHAIGAALTAAGHPKARWVRMHLMSDGWGLTRYSTAPDHVAVYHWGGGRTIASRAPFADAYKSALERAGFNVDYATSAAGTPIPDQLTVRKES
jgi:hypothetical protein